MGSQYLQEMDDVNTDTRVTQIDEEGTVLYDSHGINSKDENHAQRKEIKEALEKGHGQAKRMSETVGRSFITMRHFWRMVRFCGSPSPWTA